MKTILKLVSVAVLMLPLAGCIYVNESWEGTEDSNWQQRERNNREEINRLVMGMEKQQVLVRLGQHDFSEAYQSEGSQFTVLFYRTHKVHSDGMTTKDETTPLVFRDDELIGWGDTAYQDVEAVATR